MNIGTHSSYKCLTVTRLNAICATPTVGASLAKTHRFAGRDGPHSDILHLFFNEVSGFIADIISLRSG
jgi:hypothetical protein